MNQELFTRIRDLLQAEHQAEAALIVGHAEGPIVFLIDEHHGMAEVIRDNVEIVRTLIQNTDVSMIAVEGIEGDRISRQHLMSPDPDKCFGVSRLALPMTQEPRVEVVGVDSLRLFKEIEKDCSEGKCNTAAAHPNQQRRSAHMLHSLTQKLNERPRVSAAVFTAGTRHIDDIERDLHAAVGQQDSAAGPSFIRVRSRLYPRT